MRTRASSDGSGGRYRIAVELVPGAIPIAGRVVPSVGDALDFSGYVELILALESLRPPRPAAAVGSEV